MHNYKDMILFLHGFLGNANDWNNVIKNKIFNNYQTLAIDLPGHGNYKKTDDLLYTEDDIINYINNIINQFNQKSIILIGYSLGARAALSFACNYPQQIKALILESGTAGIEDEQERLNRLNNDKLLAQKILDDYASFINTWYDSAIFSSLNKKEDIKNELISKRLNNNPSEVVKLLVGFSQGAMKPKYKFLSSLNFPVLLLTGSLDEKYTLINKKLNKLIPNSKHIIINNAGHIPHVENEDDFIKVLEKFLETL